MDQNTYLDGACEEVPIMRPSSSKRGPIVKRKFGTTLRKLETCLERVDLPPELNDLFFFSSKIEGRGNYREFCRLRIDDLNSTYGRAGKKTFYETGCVQ